MIKHPKLRFRPATIISIVLFVVIVGVTGFAYTQRHTIQRTFERLSLPEPIEYTQVSLPTSAPAQQPVTTTQPVDTPPLVTVSDLPPEVNLAIPFTSQAPHGIWEDPYKEFCEEASVLMAISYIRQQTIPTPDFAAEAMNKIKDFEDTQFGYYKDTTIAETATIVQEYFEYDNIEIVDDPTIEDIQRAVASGKPVIIPASGRDLGNPHFTAPGPLYHMLVIKGYTKNGQFITNDPGTRFGADYLYSYETIMNAIHDWRPDGQVTLGKKVILIVG